MPEIDHIEFMREAIALAAENVISGRGGPFGAVVVLNGEIIGRGMNRVTVDDDPTAHAEIVAIREACLKIGSFQLTSADIYTSCEPCPMCLGAIYWARPRSVYFAAGRHDAAAAGFDDEMIYREVSASLADRRLKMIQIGKKEALDLFTQWEASDSKTPY